MVKFEYKIFSSDIKKEGEPYNERIVKITGELNEFGKEGWEAVSIGWAPGPFFFILLKRNIP